ncbi:nucleotide exchange factor GrpE [Corynebacterium glyciniphilum]|uniref:nucleotide exchange factor GrpE n=1 Tax=Corynebacterium glyciniphilum TaxID=1404244 RepID=UPI0011AB7B8F|nr:nucleotide exchange factor GrpE [Corynebacterium glyciniphilum]
MPDNPGDPDMTDEEYTSPDLAETTPEEDAVIDAEAADGAVDAETVEAEEAAEETTEALAGEAEDGVPETADADIDGSGELSDAEAQLAERTADLQRVSAEFANYRRRTERDRVGIGEAAKADVAASLLPIRDDLDLAEQHGDLNGPLKAVADKLDSVLNGLKVETFGAEGDEFDPSKHEAVQDTSSGDDKAVGTVLRRGYRLGDRVLRTAMVVIADR